MHKKTFEEMKIVAAARRKRPICLQCARHMEPQYKTRDKKYLTPEGVSSHLGITGVQNYGYSRANLFCSLRCGFRWADNHATRR